MAARRPLVQVAGRLSEIPAGDSLALPPEAVVDINGLTEEVSIDPANDWIPIWDASAGATRKAKPNNLGIAGGSGPSLGLFTALRSGLGMA